MSQQPLQQVGSCFEVDLRAGAAYRRVTACPGHQWHSHWSFFPPSPFLLKTIQSTLQQLEVHLQGFKLVLESLYHSAKFCLEACILPFWITLKRVFHFMHKTHEQIALIERITMPYSAPEETSCIGFCPYPKHSARHSAISVFCLLRK